ncbi:MAG: pyruvate dehydrogenase complex E1 component subunit beta [Pelagibacterales bacterium]|nr:pyruvate dehydrogenase complex E1 component subunit beta [Pelagibacterales bacterium]
MISVRESIRDAIAEEMRNDPDVFLIGEEVAEYQGAYKVSQGLLEEFGSKRVIDTPITEAGFTGLAVGAAMNGLKPVVEFMTWNFAMQAIDHIINSAAKTFYMSGGKLNIPIVFRGPNGIASRVAAQHSQDFSAWYSHVPGLKVVAPFDSNDAKLLLKSSIRDENPVVFLEHELLYNEKFDIDNKEKIPNLGKAKIIKEGKDITIVSFSRGLLLALKSHEILKELNISAEIINLRTLKPIDKNCIINSVKKTGRILVIEEGWQEYGVGAEIISIAVEKAFDYLDAEPIRISGKNVPLPYAENLEKAALPQLDEVIQKSKEICYFKEKNQR